MGGASLMRIAIRMLAVAVLARLVTPADFGIAAASLIVVDFAIMLGQLGLSSAIIQRQEILARHVATAFGVGLLLTVLLTVGMWFAGPVFAHLLAIDEVSFVTKFLTLMVLFRVLGGLSEAILARSLKSREIAMSSLISWALATFFVAIPLAYLDFGYWALVAMSIAEAAVWCSMLAYFAREELRTPWIDRQSLSELIPLGIGFAVMAPFSFMSKNIDRLLLARLLGASDLGLYSRSAFLAKTGLTVFSGIMRTTAFPSLSIVQGDAARVSKALRSGLAVTALLTVPAGVFCACFAVEIVSVMLGSRWAAAAIPLATFGVSFYPVLGQRFLISIFQSTGRPYALIPIQILYLVLLSVLIIGLHEFGLSAVCLGVATAAFVQFYLSLRLTKKTVIIEWAAIAKLHWPSLLSGFGVLLVGLATKYLTFGMSSWVTLGLGIVMVSFSLLVATYVSPTLFLGREGIDLAKKVLGSRASFLGSGTK